MALEREVAYFEQHKDELLRNYAGQFLLIREDALVGAYTTAAQAYEAGVQRFGNTPFLIRQAVETEPRADHYALTFGLISAGFFNHLYRDPNGNPVPMGLVAAGPVLPVEVHIPSALAAALAGAGQPLPPPITGVALIDTGATLTAVDEATAVRLGLNPVGVVQGFTAGGQVQQQQFPVRFAFPALGLDLQFAQSAGVNLTGQTILGQPLLALIGRDVLAQCVLTYNGPLGVFTLAW